MDRYAIRAFDTAWGELLILTPRSNGIPCRRILPRLVKTRSLQRSPHCHPDARTPPRTRLPPSREQDSPRYQSGQHPSLRHRAGQARGLWRGGATQQSQIPAQHICRDPLLDGAGGDLPDHGLRFQGGYLVARDHRHGARTRGAAERSYPPDESAISDPKGAGAEARGE